MIGLFLMMRRPTSCKRTTTPIPYTTLFRSTVRDSAAGSAHHRADPRYQLSGAERLAHVIIGTDRKPDDGVHFLTTSSQHHHVCIRKCRSEEHTSELHSLMRISYAVFFLTQKNNRDTTDTSLTSHT